jgi:hypothetical protein
LLVACDTPPFHAAWWYRPTSSSRPSWRSSRPGRGSRTARAAR